MKRLRKATAAVLLAAMCAMLLAGCHGQREQAAFTVPEEFDASQDYTITFWAKNDTNINQTNIYRQAIADFQELYPNITVDLRLYTDYGDLVIVAGRPSAGKTALALQMAAHMGRQDKVGFYSLETSTAKLPNRLVANRCIIDFSHMLRV